MIKHTAPVSDSDSVSTEKFSTGFAALAACVAVLFALILSACSKSETQSEQPEQPVEISEWVLPPEPVLIDDPLDVQVSQDPVVYICHYSAEAPKKPESTTVEEVDYENESIVVRPASVEDVYSRVMDFVAVQKLAEKEPWITLSGDDRATCGPFLQVIDECKRAGVTNIVFETSWRRTGIAYKNDRWCGVVLLSAELPENFKTDSRKRFGCVTLTLPENNTIIWEKETVSPDTFIEKIHEHSVKYGAESAFVVINVDAGTFYPSLRYVLDQVKRTGIMKVTMQLRKPSP